MIILYKKGLMNFLSLFKNNTHDKHKYQNELENDNYSMNTNCKSIKLIYQNKFIQIVNIYRKDINSLREKLKNILYEAGNVIYRSPFENEVIERTSPNQTLEYLIKRGAIENNPRVVIRKELGWEIFQINFDEINNGDKIQVEFENKVYGTGVLGMLEFVDVDNLTKPKILKFSKKGNCHKWRNVSIGLNLFGKCINKSCQAYNKEVIHIVGINRKFDFNTEKKEIKCPLCYKCFIPITMGFWKCEYQIKGEKLKNGDYESININGKETKGNDFEYYDPYVNETSFWSSLIIFTGHRQKMKYKKNSL